MRFCNQCKAALLVAVFFVCLGSVAMAAPKESSGAIDEHWIESEITKTQAELQA